MMNKELKRKELKSLRNKRGYERKKERIAEEKIKAEILESKMSNLSKFHNSIKDSMELSVDQFIKKGADLSETAKNVIQNEERVKFLSSISAEELMRFSETVNAENKIVIQAGKKVKSYNETNEELAKAELAVREAEIFRDQLIRNQQANMARLSDKALRVMQLAHARISLNKMSSKESTPASSPPDSPSHATVAEEGKVDEPIRAVGGGGVMAKATHAITSYFTGSSSSSEQATKRARNT